MTVLMWEITLPNGVVQNLKSGKLTMTADIAALVLMPYGGIIRK